MMSSRARPTPRFGVLLVPSTLLLILFFIGPMGIMLDYSLRAFNGPAQVGEIERTTANYVKFFSDPFYWHVLGRTLLVSACVATLAVMLSYPIAYVLARSTSRLKIILMVIAVLPLITNLVVRNYGWMVILSEDGLLNATLQALGLPTLSVMFTTFGVIIALTQVLVPFAIFPIYGAIQQINPRLEESVRGLGGRSFHVIRDVIIPLSWPGLFAGWMLTFVQAIASFATPLLIGGGGQAGQMLSTLVFTDATVTLNWPLAASTSLIVTALVMALITLQGWLTRGKS